MSAEQNKAIVSRWVEGGWNNGDLSLVDEFYANYTLHSNGIPDVQGAEEFKAFVRMYRSAFPDIHFTLEDMVAEGDKVAWRVTTRGTHQGDFMGIPPTDRPIEVSSSIVSRFEDGTWAEDWVLLDTLGMLQQLGVIPVPGQPA
jgi:steroid delta-isomerase-like uncharacterized protein